MLSKNTTNSWLLSFSGSEHPNSCYVIYSCMLVTQSCPTLCDPMDCSPPPGDLPDPGIELKSLTFLALAERFFSTSATIVQAKLLNLNNSIVVFDCL